MQLYAKNGYVLEGMLTSCCFDYLSRDPFSRFLFISMLIGGFCIPFLTILVFYVLLLHLFNTAKHALVYRFEYLKKCQISTSSIDLGSRGLRKISNSITLDNTDETISPDFRRGKISKFSVLGLFYKSKYQSSKKASKEAILNEKILRNNFFLRREKKFVKSIILSVFFFCLSWCPYAFVVVYAQFGTNISAYITPLSTSIPGILAKISVIFNPIIYILTSRDCKKFIHKMFFIKKNHSIKISKLLN